MPKHSLNALIGFAKSTTAAANDYTDQLRKEWLNPAEKIAAVNALCEQVVAADSAAKALRLQARRKAAELARLKAELYDQTGVLVNSGARICGKHTPDGQRFITLRKKLRPRRSPQSPATPGAG